MRAAHQVANALEKCQPYMRIAQGPKDRGGRSPLAHVVSGQVDEMEAPGALSKARSLKKGRRARNGSQAGQPGNLWQAKLQSSVNQETRKAAGTKAPDGDCTDRSRSRQFVLAQQA